MVDHSEILTLLKERVRVLSLIRDHYLKNQKILASADPDKLQNFDKQHKLYLEEMLQVEQNWRDLVVKIKTEREIQSENTDIIFSLTLSEDFITLYFAYKDKLYQILSEIERIKKNSSLMARKLFPFISDQLNISNNEPASSSPPVKNHTKQRTPLVSRKSKNR